MPLKHFPMDISASAGAAAIDQCTEAFGAFLMQQAGMPTGCDVFIDIQDNREETFWFNYKGRVWRFSFIMVYDMQLGKVVPFRIHFDYIREADNGTRDARVDEAVSVQRGSVC